jgi:hypothetical protein
MLISITDRSALDEGDLRQFAERRLLFALARFDSRVSEVEVVVEDLNGPRGGIDKACRITAKLHRSNDVTISDRDEDLFRCISRAADRVGRAVARAIARSRDFDRTRLAGSHLTTTE